MVGTRAIIVAVLVFVVLATLGYLSKLHLHQFTLAPNNYVEKPSVQRDARSTSSKESDEDACREYFRYKGLRLNKNITESGEFLLWALQEGCQVVVGRAAGAENQLIEYSELPADTEKKIPDQYFLPGFYFLNESTFEEKRATAQLWGEIYRESYRVPNVFALFDWSYRPDMKRSVDTYAPNAGQIHSNPLYPPCLTKHDTVEEPWTKWLQNKTILIVHPFVDSMKANMHNLNAIWSNANVIGAPSSCIPINPANFKFVRARLPVKSPKIPWVDALEDLKQEISRSGHFDVALLGCGGFGMPLLSYIKSLPHKPSGLYVGGALQLYFGIHGSRWFSNEEGYAVWKPVYTDAWTWPLESDVSFSTVGLIEDSSYVKQGQGKNVAKHTAA